MLFDNADQTARIRARWRSYATIATRAVRSGVSPAELIAGKFPFRFPDRSRPSTLSVEFTDACNLKCDYCTNPTFAHPRAYLSETDLGVIVESLRTFPVERVRVCGGEPTLHPKFEKYAQALAAHTKFLSVVTNAQWRRPETAVGLARAFDLVEVSIDAGGREQYEHARVGASFDRMVENLELLRTTRDELRTSCTINIRLMVRPTTEGGLAEERERWGRIADTVMTQFIIDQRSDGSSTDVFVPVQLQERTIPRCTMPFRDLAIRADGTVPVCHVNGTHLDESKRVILGHVSTSSLAELWNQPTIVDVRQAHRERNESKLEFCRGCSGR
ncbi:MAG: radical SAM protein [Actinomycetota bacterium]